MKLFNATASPFARKVLVAAREAGVIDRIKIISTTASPVARNEDIVAANPTGKIPTMVLDDNRVVFDSRVICEYLDSLSDNIKLFPTHPDTRLAALTLQALGDAMMDAAVLARYEGFMRPEEFQWNEWVEGQKDKLVSSLDYLESRAMDVLAGPVTIGHIATACALGYIEFRGVLDNWRASHDELAAWYTDFSQRESMKATEPS